MGVAATQSTRPLGAEGIELRLLRYFLAVFEERHFGRAARRLHISQPPLSQAIRKLETQLGVELFRRGSGGIVPTDAGVTLAAEAKKVLAGVDVAIAEARRAGGAGSALRVGATGNISIEPLHRLVAALREREVISSADVARLPALEQVRRLRDGRLDLGIFPELADEDGLGTTPFLPEEPLAVFMASDHPLTANDTITPDDLSNERVLVLRSANAPLWERIRGRLDDAGYRLNVLDDLTDGSDSRAALLAASTGRGVTLLPASILELSQADSLVARRPLDPPVSMPPTVIAWRGDPSPHLVRTIGAVVDVAGDLDHSD